MKRFGAEDADALRLLNEHVEIRFVSADQRGFDISKARIHDDLGFRLDYVPAAHRISWIQNRYIAGNVAYMGDGFLDAAVLRSVGLGIAPANASPHAKAAANLVTEASGGAGAVAEACFLLAEQLNISIADFPILSAKKAPQ